MKLAQTLWILFLMLFALPASAVELTGQLRGTLVDTEGLPVPAVVVNLTSPQMLGGRTADTDVEGSFHFLGLAPGEYKVQAIKAGFKTTVAEARVAAGQTITLRLELQLAAAGEEMVITADKPVVDVTRTETGITLSKDMLADIPNAGRDYQSAISLSAGVVGSGNANMHGGYYTGNQFYLDGVNTTDPLTGTFSMNMNFDAIEEIQVITGGMDPEYGRSMGGAVNVATQSGGNEFEGSVQILYSSTATQAYKPLPEEEESYDDQQELNESVQAYLGGPIIQDKLWFSTSLQLDNFITTESVPEDVGRPEDDPMPPRTWRSVYLYGKLTWQPSEAHRVWVQAQADPTDIRNSEQSVYTLSSGEEWFRQGGWLASAGHRWMPSANTKVETQLYTSSSYIKVTPIQWTDCAEYDEDGKCTDDPTPFEGENWYAYDPDGFSSGPKQYSYYSERTRTSLNSSWMQLFQLLGDHQSKIGIQAEIATAFSAFPGLEDGLEYWAYTDDPANLDGYVPVVKYVYDTNQAATLKGQLISGYIQDVWHPVPRLTIRGGVRFDYSNLLTDTQESVFSSFTAAPRVGVAYDLTGDGRTSVRGYYGRFYDSGYLEVSSLLAKEAGGYSVYNWDDRTGDWSTEPSTSVAPAFLKHDDFRNPYADKFNFGLSRNLGGGWGMESTFVYEASHNYWEDDEVNLIWNEDGTDVIGARSGVTEDLYRLRTPDEVFTEYTSLELAFARQFDDNWGLIGSYTWAHSYGLDKGNSTSLATGTMDNPEQYDEEVSVLGYDRPHAIKVAGSYQEPAVFSIGEKSTLGFVSGWDFRMYSGTPLRRLSYNNYYQGWNNYYGGDEDGRFRSGAYSNTDLKFGVSLTRGQAQFELTAECFNVFNNRSVTSWDTTYTDESGEIATDSSGDTLWMKPLGYDDPRYFQLGLRGEF